MSAGGSGKAIVAALAAHLGIAVTTFVAVVTAAVTGHGRWDGLGSLVIGLLLGVIGMMLAIEQLFTEHDIRRPQPAG